ncbi:hypothetical protein [Acetobacter pasteurianus]|nr:hypothetical protein [Acetobacter pasteurianus]
MCSRCPAQPASGRHGGQTAKPSHAKPPLPATLQGLGQIYAQAALA